MLMLLILLHLLLMLILLLHIIIIISVNLLLLCATALVRQAIHTNNNNNMQVVVFRVLGPRRAVCWVEAGGAVLEVDAIIDSDTARRAGGGGHIWAPRPARLAAPIRWNAARGVLEADGLLYE